LDIEPATGTVDITAVAAATAHGEAG
jgi:hypothetical protein